MPTAPQFCPTPRELDDLELLSIGAVPGHPGFNQPGSPLTLTVPSALATAATEAGAVEIVDPEGLPLARVSWPSGTVEPLTHAQYGPFRRYYLTPAQVQERFGGRSVVPVAGPLSQGDLDAIGDRPVVLLAFAGHGQPELPPVPMIRATLAAAELLPDAEVVAVPLAARDDAEANHALGVAVTGAYAAGAPVLALPGRAADEPVDYPAPIAEIVAAARPAPDEQGLVLFFTGLSGSGKSTLARALMDRILEAGERTITSLDGDVVRRNLSTGLSFSKEDRETNIRRIGWVAAEIARHGGLAVCSPIAPFDATRQQVRAMVEEAGGAFFLVHVATPLEECERRDRKGLYAKARRGEIPEFTGISSPYEEPRDADVRVDTTGRSIEDALEDVVVALREAGYLDLTGGFEARSARTSTTGEAPTRTSTAGTDSARTPDTGGASPDALDTGTGGFEARFARTSTTGETSARTSTTDVSARTSNADSASAGTSTADGASGSEERPLRVLFVCTANICRSPFMEMTARELVGDDASVDFASAGTHGFADQPMDEVMARRLRSEAAASFRSRPISADQLAWADLILTAEASHRTFILDDHPGLFRRTFTLGQFAAATAQVDEALRGRDLIEAVARHRVTADPQLDVEDPFRRGEEAADAAADRIRALLAGVAERLTT